MTKSEKKISQKLNKKDMINHILQNTQEYTKKYLNGEKVDVVKNIYSKLTKFNSLELQPQQQEQQVVKRERVPRILRELDISESDTEEVVPQVVQELVQPQPVPVQPVPQPVVQPQQPVVQELVQPVVQSVKKSKKIINNARSLDIKTLNLPVKQLSNTELKKEIRILFASYQKDLKLLVRDFKSDLIDDNELLQEFNEYKDKHLDNINNLLDTQRKISENLYEYINNLLDVSVENVERQLENTY